MESGLIAKHEELLSLLRSMGSVVVAFSAGVDSTFLLKAAHDALGDRVLAATGLSESYPEQEAAEARQLAATIGVTHVEVPTGEMSDEAYLRNAPDRCFHCKSDLFDKLTKLAAKRGYQTVVDGANADDLSDYRPGAQAARGLGVRSPLQEAGLTKRDIRALSKEFSLPTWNKPAMACLSSRIPYGQTITPDKLGRINQAERHLRALGLSQVRVRYHGDVARIEVPASEIGLLVRDETRLALVRRFKEIGFLFVTVDLEGYRSGSMNEVHLNRQVG